MQLAEALGEHLDVVGGVRLQDGEFVAGLVAVSVHDGPLLGADKPEGETTREETSGHHMQQDTLLSPMCYYKCCNMAFN